MRESPLYGGFLFLGGSGRGCGTTSGSHRSASRPAAPFGKGLIYGGDEIQDRSDVRAYPGTEIEALLDSAAAETAEPRNGDIPLRRRFLRVAMEAGLNSFLYEVGGRCNGSGRRYV